MDLITALLTRDMEMPIRLLLATLCGAGVGRQREHANKAAGLRTHLFSCKFKAP